MTKSLTRGLLAQELSCSEPAERQLYHDNFNLAYSERADRRMAQFQITTGNGLPPTNGLHGLPVGDDIIVVTWLHLARRDVLKVHPRSDRTRPVTGVFATRSPDRPNPLGLHPVTVREVEKNRLRIGPIEAIDGTPVVDIKPVHCGVTSRMSRC